MRKRIQFFKPTDIMPFGKNKGLTLAEIYQYEPTYIEWLIINKNEFIIDLDAFEKMPSPTPLAIGAVTGSQTRKDIFNMTSSLFKKASLTDNVNMLTNVREIKKGLEQSGEKLEEVFFRFSPEARMKNNAKIQWGK